MNPEYLQSLWTLVVTVACYVSVVAEILSPNLAAMPNAEVDETITAYDEIVRENPEDADAYLRRGSAYVSKKEFDKALADFETVIRLKPESATGYYFRAMAWQEQSRFDQAIVGFGDAIRRDPNHALSYLCRGQILKAQGKIEAALLDFHEGIRLAPQVTNGYANRGCIYLDQNKSQLALADFNEALRLDPQCAEALCGRGLYWHRQHAWEQAMNDYDEAIRIKPDLAVAFALRGLTHSARKKWDEAFADFEESLRLNPNEPSTYGYRAATYIQNNQRNEAIADLDVVIAVQPENVPQRLMRGAIYQMNQDIDRAISDYNAILKLDPRNANVHWMRALAYVEKHEYAKALMDTRITDELNPRIIPNKEIERIAGYSVRAATQKLAEWNGQNRDNVRVAAVYRDRGFAYESMTFWDKALADLDEAIRLDDSMSMSYACRGRIWMQKRDWDRAVEDFDAALRWNPSDATVLTDRGIARSEKHEWAAACEDFTLAIELDPSRLRTYAHRGAAWHAQGEWDRAIADLDQVTGHGPIITRVKRHWTENNRDAPADTKVTSQNVTTANATITTTANTPPNLLATGETDFAKSIRSIVDPTANFAVNIQASFTTVAQANQAATTTAAAAKPAETPQAGYDVGFDPDYLSCFKVRAACYEARREWSKAFADYEELIRMTSSEPMAYQRMAALKATCPDDGCRNGIEALEYAKAAVKITRNTDPISLAVLAAAHAELGEFARAIDIQTQAHALVLETCEREFQARQKHFESLEFDRSDDAANSTNTRTVEVSQKACEQSEWKDVALIERLADAYADANQFEQAITCQERAHNLTMTSREKPYLERLNLYRDGKAFRDESLVK